ncbi:MAG: hypothetical protein LBK18_00925 [Prevotellaceae bacterium]|nr:hypothetical protein [Prevotellaceae bacterium]
MKLLFGDSLDVKAICSQLSAAYGYRLSLENFAAYGRVKVVPPVRAVKFKRVHFKERRVNMRLLFAGKRKANIFAYICSRMEKDRKYPLTVNNV